MSSMKKYIAEFFGTFVLVFFGCGTAVVTGGFTAGIMGSYVGVAAIALSFGLSIVAAAYAIGHISGCHVNPAVSLSVALNGGITWVEFIGYVVAQFLGGLLASAIFAFIEMNTSALTLGAFGANGFDALSGVGLNAGGAFVVELVLTMVFCLTILGVTSSEKTSNIAGIVIGMTLTFVHLIGIPLTGTSVNPARSFAPAVFTAIFGDATALSQVWLFIVAPLVGALFAGLLWKFVFKPGDKVDNA